jgi:hypothetical protein
MPSKTKKQHSAMCAASKGKGTLGIPERVGKEFCSADKGKKFPSKGGGKKGGK